MHKKITFWFFSTLVFTALILPFGMFLGQNQLQWTTTYSIEVCEDGSAAWTIERRVLLQTEEDENNFGYYTSFSYLKSELKRFSNETREMVNRAAVSTGRNMSAEKFKITAFSEETATGSYGVIKYQYNWIGFAEVEDGKITVGDVFLEGPYLYRDDTLVMKYSPEYRVVSVLPTPDDTRESDRTLIWYGPRNFEAGEPNVVLRKGNVLQGYMPLIVGLLIAGIVGMGSAGLWFFKFRKKEIGVVVSPAVKLAIEDDKEKVVKLLREAGGSMYQSTITKRCGFSKSKTSGLLKTMEKKGEIQRQKKGREKLVTLTEQIT